MKVLREMRLTDTQRLVLLEPEEFEPRHTVAVEKSESQKKILYCKDFCGSVEEAVIVFMKRSMFSGALAFTTVT